MARGPSSLTASTWLLLSAFSVPCLPSNPLDLDLGRNQVRVMADPVTLEPGDSIFEWSLVERLLAMGYRRVRGRQPGEPGEFFWGFDSFQIYLRDHLADGRVEAARLWSLDLDRETGVILAISETDDRRERNRKRVVLEAAVVAEALDESRAPRVPVHLVSLPEHVWRCVLAIEDARFFDHPGVDARSVARAAVANVVGGGVSQGGSTITQQLIKNRDLSPKRTMGRKASEAVRALALEADYSKEEILEAYLDTTYFGHVEGRVIHGLGTASQAFFSKSARDLDLAEAALLAGMIQGPNGLSPIRNPERSLARQRQVLERMEQLGWSSPSEVRDARAAGLPRLRITPPAAELAPATRLWIASVVAEHAAARLDEDRGVVVESSLDAALQRSAEMIVAEWGRRLAGRGQIALVAVDAQSGGVLAHVGGIPGSGGEFDRVRSAARQPGSTLKPFVLLEALEGCGKREPLTLASRVSDRALRLDLPSGPWEPRNPDGRNRDVVTVRQALVESLNLPFVRIGQWCGFESTADRMRRAGFTLSAATPPAFVLGAVEQRPLDLAMAYTTFEAKGEASPPRIVFRLRTPSGSGLARLRSDGRRVASEPSSWLVREALRSSTSAADLLGADLSAAGAWGKTGTSSDGRDAWYAGGLGGVVAVVWVGRDDGLPAAVSGAGSAAPVWRDFMRARARLRPVRRDPRPRRIFEAGVPWRVSGVGRDGGELEFFRRGAGPKSSRGIVE